MGAPIDQWKALQEFPNTVSKIKSMRSQVEEPLRKHFGGRKEPLAKAAERIGGTNISDETPSADLAFRCQPLPKVPIMLLFWDADRETGFEAKVKLAFDETITEHLDIESIIFLCEHLARMLINR